MSISDDELVRRLETMPMVDPPDFREPVLGRIRGAAAFRPPAGRQKPAVSRFALGLAWAAAVAIVVGIAFFRAPAVRVQNAGATMAAPEIRIQQDGDRFIVQPAVSGTLDWDHNKLTKAGELPDGGVVLRPVAGASGNAEIRLQVPGKETLKTSVAVP